MKQSAKHITKPQTTGKTQSKPAKYTSPRHRKEADNWAELHRQDAISCWTKFQGIR